MQQTDKKAKRGGVKSKRNVSHLTRELDEEESKLKKVDRKSRYMVLAYLAIILLAIVLLGFSDAKLFILATGVLLLAILVYLRYPHIKRMRDLRQQIDDRAKT